jgi:hypothetical protein
MEPKKLSLLPPPADKCPCCAVAHPDWQAHDATSLYYAFWFNEHHGRSPTWADGIEHCPPNVKQQWIRQLNGAGIDVNSIDKRGGIQTDADLKARMARSKLEGFT